MNSYPLNGASLNRTISYATSAGLAGEVDMLFIVSEQNNAPISGNVTLAFTAAGQLSSVAILSAPTVTMAFGMTGDGLFNNTFLVGNTGIGFASTGGLSKFVTLAASDTMTLDATGALQLVGHVSGEVDVVFTANGTATAIRFLDGAIVYALDLTGTMSMNPSEMDDDERQFRRPFTQREFRR